jgi:beta-glucanase (GH16 family)
MKKAFTTPFKFGIALLLAPFIFFSCTKQAFNQNTTTNTTNNNNNNNNTGNTSDTTSYTLVWSDEFNGTAVDTTKWGFVTGSLNVNQEEEYYQPSNATVANGYLMITAKNQSQGGFSYTSARMSTANKFNVTYGKIEARIALPIGAGLWPAFWMLGSDINTGTTWPSCGEIDIMEHIDTDSLIYGTMHWLSGGQAVQYGLNMASSPSQFHIYSVVWNANSIQWYVDNTLYVTGNIANNVNSTGAFHSPFFILLNLAVGGSWPGLTVDQSKLPATMYVDYVRVYQAAN